MRIKLEKPVTVPPATHAEIQSVTVDFANSRLVVLGILGHIVEGPEGPAVVQTKERSISLMLSPEARELADSLIKLALDSGGLKGSPEE